MIISSVTVTSPSILGRVASDVAAGVTFAPALDYLSRAKLSVTSGLHWALEAPDFAQYSPFSKQDPSYSGGGYEGVASGVLDDIYASLRSLLSRPIPGDVGRDQVTAALTRIGDIITTAPQAVPTPEERAAVVKSMQATEQSIQGALQAINGAMADYAALIEHGAHVSELQPS